MSRLLVQVEGQTEETFVNKVLAPHLWTKGYHLVSARLMGNARQRLNRGGVKPWTSAKPDIVRHLQEDVGRVVTTMVDYYALPNSGAGAWPGRLEAGSKPHAEKAKIVQAAMLDDIAQTLGSGFDKKRFVPFVVMHEYEGILFSAPKAFAESIGAPSIAPQLEAIRNEFNSPEEINDSPLTAPSKRVLGVFPSYQKVLHGNVAAEAIGLTEIRNNCPHFANWVDQLEDLPDKL